MLSPVGDCSNQKYLFRSHYKRSGGHKWKGFLFGNKVFTSSMDYPTILDSFSKAIRMFTKQVIIGGCSQYIECHTAMSHKECEGWLGFAIPFLFYHWFWHLHVKSSFPPASWGLWFYVHFATFSRSLNINLPYVIDKRATRALPWRVKCNRQTQKYATTPCGGDPCGEVGTGVTQT